MPRRLPPLADQYGGGTARALKLAEVGEVIRTRTPTYPGLAAHLTVPRLELLYEVAYLKVFIGWEQFLEESFLRYLCGFSNSIGNVNLTVPKCATLTDARNLVVGGRQYVPWADPARVISRARGYFANSLHEQVIASDQARIESFWRVRNQIAHGTDSTRALFNSATMHLAGKRYRGCSAGAFLRDWVPNTTPPVRWLQSIGDELVGLAQQIAP